MLCIRSLYFDAIRVKVRDEGTVRNKALYVALGIRRDGVKEILGLWMEQTEGAKFWLRVMPPRDARVAGTPANELKHRGMEDVLIAVVDGLKGFPDAITATFPKTQVQTCIVHLIRNSLAFVPYKDRKAVAAALKAIYRAANAQAGAAELDAFIEGVWGKKYPAIGQSWKRAWPEVIPFFAFPDEVRRLIYTTNAIESLNAKIRRAVRTSGHLPSDESAMKLVFLVLRLVAEKWRMPAREWMAAKAQFAIVFEDRFTPQ
jgi:putative transposase